MEEELENQGQSKETKAKKIARIQPYMWRKGQSGNPAGRPKGKTMKEYARELLERQTEEERQEFLHGLSKDIIWKMAEGMPETKGELEHKGNIVIQIDNDIATKNEINTKSENNSQEQQTI